MIGLRGWRKAALVAGFLAPSFICLVAFVLGPMGGALWISLQDWNLISPPVFVGLDNYRTLFSDPAFHEALLHTVLFIGGYLPLAYAGGLGLALLANRKLKGAKFFRAVYFLPVITSWVVVALVWKWLLNPRGGLVNSALGLIGIEGPGWWTEPGWALISVILASAWKDLGFVMVILLAGLQAIPEDLYEAARLDGGNAWQRLRYVTLPLLSPSSFFVVMISMINGFQVFDQVLVMTEGSNGTSVLVEQIWRNTFSYGAAGYAAAMSWVLFLIVLVLTIVGNRLQRRWVTYA